MRASKASPEVSGGAGGGRPTVAGSCPDLTGGAGRGALAVPDALAARRSSFQASMALRSAMLGMSVGSVSSMPATGARFDRAKWASMLALSYVCPVCTHARQMDSGELERGTQILRSKEMQQGQPPRGTRRQSRHAQAEQAHLDQEDGI